MQGNARKQGTVLAKHWFHTLDFDGLHHPLYNYDMATHNLHSFRALQRFIAEKFFIEVEEVLITVLPQQTAIFSRSFINKLNQCITDIIYIASHVFKFS